MYPPFFKKNDEEAIVLGEKIIKICKKYGMPSCLKNLINIKSLSFDNNNITDISVVSNFSNLEALGMNNNKIKDIKSISNLTKLGVVQLSHNEITDITSMPVDSIINSNITYTLYSGCIHQVIIDNNYIDFGNIENKQIIDKFAKAGWGNSSYEQEENLFQYEPQKVDSNKTENVNLSTNNIKIDSTTNVIPKNTVLLVQEITSGSVYDIVSKALETEVSKFIVYDITLECDNVKIQPSGKVTVSIPIPEGFNKENIGVYRVDDNGAKIQYEVTVQENYVVFETDHFSTYVLAEKQETMQIINKGEKDDTPKTGIVDMTYIIIIVAVVSGIGIIAFRKK